MQRLCPDYLPIATPPLYENGMRRRGGGGGGSLRERVQALFPKYAALGGMWDFSDMATLWQDAAGTVPVTAAGQPVGLVLDLSGNDVPVWQTDDVRRPTFNGNGVTTAGNSQFLRSNGDLDLSTCDKVVAAVGYLGGNEFTSWMMLEFGFTEAGTFYMLAGLGVAGRYETATCSGIFGGDPSNEAYFPVSQPAEYGAHISRHSLPGNLSEVWWNGAKGVDGTGNKGGVVLSSRPIHLFSRSGASIWGNTSSRNALVLAVPVAQPQVSDDDVELIRQWMMEGA